MKKTKLLGHVFDKNGKTERGKCGSNIKIETTGEYERSEIIFRNNAFSIKMLTETFGTNRSTEKTIAE